MMAIFRSKIHKRLIAISDNDTQDYILQNTIVTKRRKSKNVHKADRYTKNGWNYVRKDTRVSEYRDFTEIPEVLGRSNKWSEYKSRSKQERY